MGLLLGEEEVERIWYSRDRTSHRGGFGGGGEE